MKRSLQGWASGRPIERILVIRRKALGDALVALPAVLRLSAAFPAARLDLVVDRPLAPLFARLATNLRIQSWPPADGSAGSWLWQLRSNRYDLVLDYLGSPRTAWWTAASGAPLRVGYDVRFRGWAYNVKVPRNRASEFDLTEFAGEAFLDPLRALGLGSAPWRPATAGSAVSGDFTPAYRRWLGGQEQQPSVGVGLVLSATWSAKAWPPAHAGTLYRLLEREGARPLFITGPGDEKLEAALREQLPEARFAPPTNLLELSDLLSRLDLLIATDCGARHLAACLQVPTITLFGPTDPRGWNPEDPRHVALRTGEPCSPCDLTECPVPGHPCLDDLRAEQVLEEVRKLWRRLPGWRLQREGAEG